MIRRDLDVSREIKFLNGNFNKNKKPSFFFFTINKSASSFVTRVLQGLSSFAKIDYINLEKYYFHGGEIGNKWHEDGYSGDGKFKNIFENGGYFFGPFRRNWPKIDLKDNRIILLLRDPRDVLTSLYFSILYSHQIPKTGDSREFMIHERESATKSNIDDYVLDSAHYYNGLYKYYCDNILGNENVLFLKYEDMVQDFGGFIARITNFLGYSITDNELKALLKMGDFSVDSEDIYSHKRQVTPGDHRRKLKNKTIVDLNKIFSDVLEKLNYDK